MRVLVATHETQGEVEGDFSFCMDGELVRFPIVVCDSGDECGCARCFDGVASQRGTTTAKVVDRPDLDPDLYPELLYPDLASWCLDPDDPEVIAWRDEQARFLAVVARMVRLGSVVTVERERVSVRKQGAGPSALFGSGRGIGS